MSETFRVVNADTGKPATRADMENAAYDTATPIWNNNPVCDLSFHDKGAEYTFRLEGYTMSPWTYLCVSSHNDVQDEFSHSVCLGEQGLRALAAAATSIADAIRENLQIQGGQSSHGQWTPPT